MDKERLKKLLATFSLATLLSGAGVTTVGGSSS
ncbi:MAG TPA: SbtA family thio(seleno)oxazole RiPP natural product precursor [Desulfatiglandales bacterium]|nr:SbtA family thio(seleno)oxazole RiPP natural product precursor [Desulfatiglandales bacterium]